MSYSLLFALILGAVDPPGASVPASRGRLPDGTGRAMIICGHPGDESHRAMYAQSVQKIHHGLMAQCGFSSKHIWVRFGSKPREGDTPAISSSRGLSRREGIEADVAELRKQIRSEDALWVIVLGHAHFDGRHSFLNLPGPDMPEDEFGKLFQAVQCREQVYFITTPVSGFFIKPLSAKGRIVISATEADLLSGAHEVNETRFHLSLAEVLSDPPKMEEYDRDRDGRITVLDLYLTVVRRVILRYRADENIPTEHAQLDDNGDRRETELQIDYLEPELEGRAKKGVIPILRPLADGALAARTVLHYRPASDFIRMLYLPPVPAVAPVGGVIPIPDVNFMNVMNVTTEACDLFPRETLASPEGEFDGRIDQDR